MILGMVVIRIFMNGGMVVGFASPRTSCAFRPLPRRNIMDFRVGKRPLIGRDMTSAIWQLAHNQTESEFVRYWPLADMQVTCRNVRFRG